MTVTIITISKTVSLSWTFATISPSSIQGSGDCEERFRQCEKISLKETVAEKAEEVDLWNYDSLVILNHVNFKSKFSGHLKHSNFNQSKFLNDNLKHLN